MTPKILAKYGIKGPWVLRFPPENHLAGYVIKRIGHVVRPDNYDLKCELWKDGVKLFEWAVCQDGYEPSIHDARAINLFIEGTYFYVI